MIRVNLLEPQPRHLWPPEAVTFIAAGNYSRRWACLTLIVRTYMSGPAHVVLRKVQYVTRVEN